LQAEVHVRGELGVFEKVEKAIAKAFRLDGTDAQPEVAVQIKNLFNQRFKVNMIIPVAANVHDTGSDRCSRRSTRFL